MIAAMIKIGLLRNIIGINIGLLTKI